MTPTELHNLMSPIWEKCPECRPTYAHSNLRYDRRDYSWMAGDRTIGDDNDAAKLIEWSVDRALEKEAGPGGWVDVSPPDPSLDPERGFCLILMERVGTGEAFDSGHPDRLTAKILLLGKLLGVER